MPEEVNPNRNQIGQSGGEPPKVAPPPPPPVSIRTMESDLSSMKQTGGGAPVPIDLAAGAGKPSASPPSAEADDVKISIPGYSGPEEAVFSAATVVPPSSEEAAPSRLPKAALGVGAGLLALIALGLGFYFYAFPIIFPPAGEPAGEVSPAAESAEETSPPLQPAFVHKSFFASPADLIEELKPETLTLEGLKAALAASAAKSQPAGTFKEAVITVPAGAVSFPVFLRTVFPDLTKAPDLFEDDYTVFMYYDEKGVWPGVIAKLKLKGSAATAAAEMKKIESSPNLKNLYLKDPGAVTKDGFRPGRVGNFTDMRYAVFESGAAVDYGWLNDYFAFSTSYAGLQEAVKRLGL